MSRTFKAQVNIIKKPYDRPVHFKVDGGRFDLERTVKFNVNSKYVLEFTFRPTQILEFVIVQGTKLTVEEQDRKDECSVYRAEWLTTGLDKCKKGARQSIQVIMQIKNVGEIKCQIQCKFYGEHEMQHTCWGTVLTYIEYECKTSDTNSYVDVLKEVYR